MEHNKLHSLEVAAGIEPEWWSKMTTNDKTHIRREFKRGGPGSENFARRVCNAMHKLQETYSISWSPPPALLSSLPHWHPQYKHHTTHTQIAVRASPTPASTCLDSVVRTSATTRLDSVGQTKTILMSPMPPLRLTPTHATTALDLMRTGRKRKHANKQREKEILDTLKNSIRKRSQQSSASRGLKRVALALEKSTE